MANSTTVEQNSPHYNSAKNLSKSTPASAALVRVPQTLPTETVIAQEPNGSTTTVQRNNSNNIIVAFQRRRSQSQMEFSPQSRRAHAHQYGKYQQYQRQHHDEYHHPAVEHQIICEENPIGGRKKTDSKMSSTTFLLHKIYDQRLYEGLHTPESYTAGMRIFCHIMLNAWRKRRDEVRRLIEETNDLKRGVKYSFHYIYICFSIVFIKSWCPII